MRNHIKHECASKAAIDANVRCCEEHGGVVVRCVGAVGFARVAARRRVISACVSVGVAVLLSLSASAASAAAPAGSLFAFGDNLRGELGSATNNGTNSANPTPTAVVLPGQVGTVTQVAAGEYHSLVVTSSGQLYAFGENLYGQLGNATNNGTLNANPTPTPVVLPGLVGTVTQVAAGDEHSLVVTSSGQLYAFGANYYGQLGTVTHNGMNNTNPTPTAVVLPRQVGTVTQVAGGGGHSLVVTSSGQLYAFGYNGFGQLGNATNIGMSNANPTAVVLPGLVGTVTQVAAGGGHSLALTSSGQLYAFGYNYFGELGNATNNGTTNANPTPTAVVLPGQVGTVTQLAAGEYHSLALTSSGQLYTFGDNFFGELGNAANNGTSNANPTPTAVVLPRQVGTVTQVAAGSVHSLVVTSSGQLYTFGDNFFGELGNGTGSANPTPTPVVFAPGTTIDTVAKGSSAHHTLAIVSGLAITSESLPGGQVGSLYSATMNAAGGTAPITWSASGLPGGLSINASSGVISGAPGTAGSFPVTVTATDRYGSQATHTFTLSIAALPKPRPKPPAQSTTTSFGNQHITLLTPSLLTCTAHTGTLVVSLSSTTIAHSRTTKLKFASAALYLDKGIKHVRTRTHHPHNGKPKHITVTTYTANSTVHHLPAALALRLASLKHGAHTLTVTISYTHTIRKHGRNTTITTTKKKLTARFNIC